MPVAGNRCFWDNRTMKRMMRISLFVLCTTALSIGAVSCKSRQTNPVELKHYPITQESRAISRDGLSFDQTVTSDGSGSFRMQTDKPATFRLFETGDIDVENARLIYRARVRTEGIQGIAYLEMWCQLPGKGEFFSRSLQSPLTGTNDWSTVETPFFLEKGQNPSNIKLNFVIEGKGTAWLDDIHLFKAPLS